MCEVTVVVLYVSMCMLATKLAGTHYKLQIFHVQNVTGFGKTLRMGSARDSRNARF